MHVVRQVSYCPNNPTVRCGHGFLIALQNQCTIHSFPTATTVPSEAPDVQDGVTRCHRPRPSIEPPQNSESPQTKGNGDGVVNLGHGLLVEASDRLHKPSSVYSPDLLEKRDRNLVESGGSAFRDEHVRGRQRQADGRCDRRHDGGSQIFVGDVILNDERGTRLFDLVADGGVESY